MAPQHPHTRRAFLAALGVATAASATTGVARQPSPAAPAQGQDARLDATAQLLKALSEAPGPSAFEEDVRAIVAAEFTALGAGIEYDGLGSVHATLPGNATGPRIMVTAHMDEVGLMVQHVTPDGYLRVKALGGPALDGARTEGAGHRHQRAAHHARAPRLATRHRLAH